MKFHTIKNIVLFLFLAIVFNGCTETYPLITSRYEEVIVVEATLTNELKKQEVKITKTAKFEDEGYLTESGAQVFITDDAGNQYDFVENSGTYISSTEFRATPNTKYQLHINTKDGRSFESSAENLTAINPIQSVEAKVEQKDNVNGVSIKVNSFDAAHSSNYYRYEYEETYKIVAPKWTLTKAVWDPNGFIVYMPNLTDTKTCYASGKNYDLLLANTNNLTEDKVNFLVRFISDQNYIITTRYSILVKQYIESLEAFNYYSTLKKISGSGSIVSPNQPGFLLGNLKSVKNPNDKIAGYFDVCSVSTERIYFNYADLFPGKKPPPYVTDCKEFCYAVEPFVPDPCTHYGGPGDDLAAERIKYFSGMGGRTFWVEPPCGDCTTIASNIKPTFWTD